MEIKIRLNAVFLLIVEEADPIRGEKFHLFTGYFIQSICLFICYYIKQYNY